MLLYIADTQLDTPEERDAYQAVEVKDKLCGEVAGRGIRWKYRLIFVPGAAKARQEAEQREGVYVLKTNLPAKTHPTAKALATSKEQTPVERRFGNRKGPLAVAPMFLEKPARRAGLLCILVWALMVMALMERALRRNLKGKPLSGLYPENRPSAAPTSTALLECFSTVCIVIVKHHGTLTRRLAQFTPIQHKLIQLLDIPPTALQTFKRRRGM